MVVWGLRTGKSYGSVRPEVRKEPVREEGVRSNSGTLLFPGKS